MLCLLDTGILLRFVDQQDPLHSKVKDSVRTLRNRGTGLVTTTQNVAEFWNVATRPVANNGLGLPVSNVINLIEQVIDPLGRRINETEQAYIELKRLGKAYGFGGKQVHDARLVAMMLAGKVGSILTLNTRDFQRYQSEGIVVLTPENLPADH